MFQLAQVFQLASGFSKSVGRTEGSMRPKTWVNVAAAALLAACTPLGQSQQNNPQQDKQSAPVPAQQVPQASEAAPVTAVAADSADKTDVARPGSRSPQLPPSPTRSLDEVV